MLVDLKKIGLNGLIYLMTAVFSKGLNILLLPVYTKYLTVEQYGEVSLLLLFKSILISIMGMGQIVTIKRTYYEYNRNNSDFRSFFSTIIIGTLFIDILLIFIIGVFGQNIFNVFFEGINFKSLGLLILLSIILLIPYQNLLKLFQTRNESLKFSFLEISFMLFDTIISLGLIIYLSTGTIGKAYGIFFSTIIIFLICVPLLIREINFTFNFSTFKKTLLLGLPIIPHGLSNLILNLSDRIFLNKASGLQVVGIYSMAYQIGQIIDIIALSFIEAWSTFFMKHAKEANVEKILSKFAEYFILGIGFIVLGLTFFSKEIILLFFDSRYYEAYLIIPIISLSYLMKTVYYITNQQMILEGRTSLLLMSTSIASIINLALNYLLISILGFGMYGAAIATVISIIIMSSISYINGQNSHYIKYDKVKILMILSLVTLGVGSHHLLAFINNDSILIKLISFIIFVVLLLILIPKKDYIKLFKIINNMKKEKV